MKPILVVEDSAVVLKILKHVLSQSTLLVADYAANQEQAKALISRKDYFAAIVDLNLPDAPSGEVVDYTRSKNIPTIVLTSSFDEERRETMLKKGIVDYVTKEGRYSYELVRHTMERLVKNESIKVLVVDDSSSQRRIISNMLKLQLFQVLEAENGVEAIKVILQNPDIKLVITDCNMPKMGGFDLIKNLRVKYEKSNLVIIGISSEKGGALSAKLIKYGANDFLNKPFNQEEFFCRVSHNIDFIELIEQVRDKGNRDDLTGIYNKKYFHQRGAELYENAKTNASPLSLAIIDCEDVPAISENYGYEVGELVLSKVAKLLDVAFSRFFIARGDGAEFYVLCPGLNCDKAVEYVERVRQLVSAENIYTSEAEAVNVSFSAGVSAHLGETLDDCLAASFECLERSKEAGGGIVVGD